MKKYEMYQGRRGMRNDLQAAVEYFEMVERNNGPDAMVHFGPVARMEMLRQYKLARTALTALRGPQPDPDTGLVPCGCGGKAFVYCPVEMTDVFVIRCEKCRVGITFAMDLPRAIKEWNTAMGWRVEG